MTIHVPFDNTYARLPERFYARIPPTPVAGPRLIRLNTVLAGELGLDSAALASPDGVAFLSGTAVPPGAEPIAIAYAGHQFGHFVPQLGDGRAILLGEILDRQGRRRDIQLKGAGPTPFSRRGDGRAALGPVLREYIVSEAMAALGIPTTRALAAVTTGEAVQREELLPGAVLTRVAASHIRIGTFQYFAARQDSDGLRALADHVIARHYPEIAGAAQPYRALLDAVVARQAALVARWQLVGFIHGVMNTDNVSVAGETIDYGPCAFMDAYHPATVFSSIDQQGRYAYANQPRIAYWNLARLAETMLPLLSADEDAALADATDAINAYPERFDAAYRGGLCAKLGFGSEREGDLVLAGDLLERMAQNGADFTLTFRRLAAASMTPADAGPDVDEPLRRLFIDPTSFDGWAGRWRERLAVEPVPDREAAMLAVNPAFIPRNHHVEAAIRAATEGDFHPFETLLAVLAQPYADQPDHASLADPPAESERVLQTFCGT